MAPEKEERKEKGGLSTTRKRIPFHFWGGCQKRVGKVPSPFLSVAGEEEREKSFLLVSENNVGSVT